MSTKGDRRCLGAGWGAVKVLPLQVITPQMREVVVVHGFHIQALKSLLGTRKTEPPTKAGSCEMNKLPLPVRGN